MLNIFVFIFYQLSITVFEILVDQNVLNVVLDMLNTFVITLYQLSITVFEILVENREKITNQGQ